MTLHAISVDVEDWYQSTIDANADLSDRFERSSQRVLEALASHNVKGTFFVLGLAAEKAPNVVKTIAEAGHEIQSHGYNHVEVFKTSESEFRQDLARAKGFLEDMIGREVFAYRAPSFSIDERTPWAMDVLAETGHRYDSSVFPIKMSRYGIDGYPPEPRIIETQAGNRIVEAPLACFDWLSKRRPCGGGGYVRLLPYWMLRKAWRQMDRVDRPGVLYMHPYEYDPGEMSQFKSSVSLKQRLHQGIGRKGFARKIDRLMEDFQFGTISDVVGTLLDEL
jgi:polysaccharide deacetylase family protein (PEP-CTERM system associated)